MTLMEMFASGDVFQLTMMGIIFIAMVLLLFMLGKGIAARSAEKDKQIPSAHAVVNTGNRDAVTAAIAAAVNEYRKTNK